METKFNFKSQICTTREQSERLLELGLKKETSDMTYVGLCMNEDGSIFFQKIPICKGVITENNIDIPAWSLCRLLSMLPDNAPRMFWILDGASISINWDNDGTDFFPHRGNMYDGLIDCIEWLIKEGYFPKEYLV